jgi:hypothetical protein
MIHIQRLVSVVQTATVTEEYNIEEQRCVGCLLWEKGLNANDIHKEILLLIGGKCLSRKAGHNWAANVSLMTKRLKGKCGSG